MSTIVLRQVKGTPLTVAEVDSNFSNLNTDKLEKSGGAITTNASTTALTITQTGTGNALVVEDSANPDATPFLIDNAGQVLTGFTTSVSPTAQGRIEASIIGSTSPTYVARQGSNSSKGAELMLLHARAGSTNTSVAINDATGEVTFWGADGTNFVESASVKAFVDGTPGTNDMPGRLVFSTTADGASSPTERMRIRSDGGFGFGSSGTAAEIARFGRNITGAAMAYGVNVQTTVQSDVSSAYLYTTYPSTQATAFTLGNLRHFSADQGSIGAGSSVTNQYGFRAEATLTGATNNYGFYGNIASGTGRYNLYMDGTADNYLAGKLGIGGSTTISVTDNTNAALLITQLGTGNALVVEDSANPDSTPFVITNNGSIIAGGLTGTYGVNFQSQNSYQETAFDSVLGSYLHFRRAANSLTLPSIVANGNILGELDFEGYDGSVYRTAASITAVVDGTPGTNDMPGRLVFSTTADGASSPTERMRIEASGNVVLKTGSLQEVKTALAALDVNISLGNYFTKTISAISTLTVSNVPATGTVASFILDLTNGGAFAITWWTNMKWASGTAPTLTASGRDILGFFTHDGGTTWNGLVLAKDIK